MMADNNQTQVATADVLRFWLDEVGPKGWFIADDGVDQICRNRFGALVEEALAGGLTEWEAEAQSALALLIVLDQFPRNLFRGEARAFAGDARALAVAARAIESGFDWATPLPERSFFYTPYEHSEDLADQERSVALFEERAQDDPNGANWLHHVKLHRDLIRRFGRFPHRNAVLGRESTPEEEEHLSGGGYAPGAMPKKG